MNEERTTVPEQKPVPEQPEKRRPRDPVANFLFDYVEIFVWSVCMVILIFTFVTRLCSVDGRSMENTLQNGERLIVQSIFYTPKQNDVIVFHLTKPEVGMEKTLVKRVIATAGQEVVLNTKTGELTVDGVLYEDAHKVLKDASTDQITGKYSTGLFYYDFNLSTGIFRTTVPEGCLFVMGDNRNNSKDSRNPDVGFVDERCVLGKVVFRLYPFTVFD